MLPGCELFHKKHAKPDPPAAIDYADLARRYNARVERIGQLYARGVVQIEWIDAKGRKRFEQGDANLMLRRPSDLALAISKFSETLYWIGSDASRYWWIEVKPGGDAEPGAYVGDHAGAGEVLGDISGPLPVGPQRLLSLLGLTPLADAAEAHPEPIAEPGGKLVWLSRPLGDAKGGGPVQMTLIDLERALPVEVKIIDDTFTPIVIAKLDRYERMEVDGAPPGAWPPVPTRIELSSPDRNARLTLFLTGPSDGKARGRIKDAQFDFEKLVKLLGVDHVQRLGPEGQ